MRSTPVALQFALPLLAVLPGCVATGPAADPAPRDVTPMLERYLAPLGDSTEPPVPALGALVLRAGRTAAAGAAGRANVGLNVPVTADSRWHLGSCTKSMTATWIAMLVERDVLAWTTTVDEVLGERFELDPSWTDVTLEQLLRHTAGAPADLGSSGVMLALTFHEGTPREARRALAGALLARPTIHPAGSTFAYSNAGYCLAATLAEERLDVEFETALARDLFAPLGMQSAGFGPPGSTPESANQREPMGHRPRSSGGLRSVGYGASADNPPALGPAGRVHATLPDWSRYAALHLAGARAARGLDDSAPPLLTPASFERLHAPELDDYAMGWVHLAPPWAPAGVLWHNGSNTMWYCELALLPESDLAVMVTCNAGTDDARRIVGEVLAELVRQELSTDE